MSTKEEIINTVWERISTQVIPMLEQTPHNWGGRLYELPLTEPYPAARFTVCVLASRESTPEKHLHIYLTSDDGVISFAETTLEKDSVVAGMEDLFSNMDNFWDNQSLKAAWGFMGDIPMDANECLEEPFLHFPAGTHREEIWHWFDQLYSKGVHALLDPHEHTGAEAGPTDQEKTADTSKVGKSTEIRNLAQLKRAIESGRNFVILEHYIHPECTGQVRKPNIIQTNGFYSVVADSPENNVSVANDGKGYWFAYGKASGWTFENGTCIYSVTRNDVKKPVWKISFI